jgi:hypothetical protein
MPTPVDLVTDLPADFEVFGQAVDSSLADLKGGTSGQVLSKNSNTDMDFVWVTSDDANAIQNSIVNAKGDIIGASANDTPAITSVGANGEMLVADSSTATGLDWKTATEQYPWQTWTPTYTNISVGNGSVTARYQQIGKTVNVEYRLIFGSTTTIASGARLTPPVSISLPSFFSFNGVAIDAGVTGYILWIDPANASLFEFLVPLANGSYLTPASVSANVPFTFGTDDILTFRATYEAV